MSGQELIPRDVLLDEGGHLSEVGVTVLGDGQSMLVPADVLLHVDGCADCCQRMGDAAMFSLELGDALRDASRGTANANASATGIVPAQATVSEIAPAREKRDSLAAVRRFPAAMVAAALVAACIGLAPTVYAAPGWVSETASLLNRMIPILAKSSYLLLKSGGASAGPLLFVAPCVSAMVLLGVGLLVAKRLPRLAGAPEIEIEIEMIGRGA